MSSSTIRGEVPLGIGATVLFGWFVQDGLTRIEGVIWLTALVVSVVFLIVTGRRKGDSFHAEATEAVIEPAAGLGGAVVRAGLGLLGVVVGAQALVFGASSIADQLGLSGGFVGMTIVAVGPRRRKS